jgi:hypothetical protein
MPADLTGRRVTIADIRPKASPEPPAPKPAPPSEPGKPLTGKALKRMRQKSREANAKQAAAADKPKGPAYTPPLPSEERYQRRLEKLGIIVADVHNLAWDLMERYPKAFSNWRVPLAVGIHQTILAETGCNPHALAEFMREWVRHRFYLMALTKAPHRVDLRGEPAGEITGEERAHARERLTVILDRRKAWAKKEAA